MEAFEFIDPYFYHYMSEPNFTMFFLEDVLHTDLEVPFQSGECRFR